MLCVGQDQICAGVSACSTYLCVDHGHNTKLEDTATNHEQLCHKTKWNRKWQKWGNMMSHFTDLKSFVVVCSINVNVLVQVLFVCLYLVSSGV